MSDDVTEGFITRASSSDDAVATAETPSTSSLVDNHPWLAMGAALAIGGAVGLLLPRARHAAATTRSRESNKGGGARSAATALAAAEAAHTLFGILSRTGASIRAGARDIAARLPDQETVKTGATEMIGRAGDTAREAGKQITQAVERTKDHLTRH